MVIKKLLLLLFITLGVLHSSDTQLPNDEELHKLIGRMLLVGFPNETIDKNSEIVRQIKQYNLGGVILFDRFYSDRTKTKNISSPNQLQHLTSKLKLYSNKPLLISIDQEGGKVARLKPAYGFANIPSAKRVSSLHVDKAKAIYNAQARMLKSSGINCDFAPVVDLAVNEENSVIYGLERSYGSNPQEVVKYASIFMDSLENTEILSVLKHFPGHGSSLGDSHKGFVDITNTWTKKELEPYHYLINQGKVKMIMTAHVFNSNLDENHPATLSHFVNTTLLRENLGYKGVVISDDLQMKAISEHYTISESVALAINAGVDILLFGNQLAEQDIDELVLLIATEVKNGIIPIERILESNRRIELLHTQEN
ncbi:glycoside hydrolase family 3 protein [Sulfurimonas sp.]|nr:glycoside hydrolase family 3 protein [Sulfurimonas sp.]